MKRSFHCSLQSFSRCSTTSTYYQILELPVNATVKDIKLQFKKLLKKYHPDMNPNLEEDAKQKNQEKFMEIVEAYDTLKDIKKKKAYDRTLRGGANSRSPMSDWDKKYYGEAKYYSKSLGYLLPSGMNSRRHRVHNFNDKYSQNKLHFSGEYVNHGDRFGVPHFDYNEHLLKHLKNEQRQLFKYLLEEDRKYLLGQLKSQVGNGASRESTIAFEELLTKHLQRNIHHYKQKKQLGASASHVGHSSDSSYVYRRPSYSSEGNDTTSARPLLYFGTGLAAAYMIYSTLLSH